MKPVADGLRNSVSFGIAHTADTPGLDISGKTGTASNPPRKPWSHGWVVGFFSTIHRTALVVSVYLPQGWVEEIGNCKNVRTTLAVDANKLAAQGQFLNTLLSSDSSGTERNGCGMKIEPGT